MSGNTQLAAKPELAELWAMFLASPIAPKHAMSALELDGYLTGVIVAPTPIETGLWMASVWELGELVGVDDELLQSELDTLAAMFTTLSTKIDRSLQRLEATRGCDYRPAFQPAAGKPAHDVVHLWARGFEKATTLGPRGWIRLMENKRLQPLFAPLVGFFDSEDFEPAEDIEERLDWAAANIPRSILLLRKIAKLHASRGAVPSVERFVKPGRNDPCPCGSGKKYKRCCGQN